MKVRLSRYSDAGDSTYDVTRSCTCTQGEASVEVRVVGDYLVVIIKNGSDNKVEMESRAAGIWINVRPA